MRKMKIQNYWGVERMPFVKVYDIVGYAIDGDVFCDNCAKDGAPVLAGDEFDYQPHCAACGKKLNVSVIKER